MQICFQLLFFSDGAIIKEERSDLIHFYNSVYVDIMQKTAMRFRNVQEVNIFKYLLFKMYIASLNVPGTF